MKHRRLVPAVAAVLLLLPLAACSVGSGGSDRAGIGDAKVSEMAPQAGDIAQSDAAAERSIVRSGDIALEVGDPAAAAEEVSGIAERLDGYVESETTTNGSEGSDAGAYLLLRVPADRLDEAFDALGEVGTVLSQSRSASDVTAQHVDLQARVQALEESVQRLTELMSGAATTGELIEAETALSQRQQELDGLRAQLEYLEGQVEQGSISVSLTAKSALPGGPANFWDGLVAGWESIVAAGSGALVLLGILLPWIAIAGVIALVVVFIVRAARGRRARRTGAAGGRPNAE